MLKIRFGWIQEFDKYVFNYVMFHLFLFHLVIVKHLFANNFFMLDTFRLSSQLLKIFTEHIDYVYSIDFSTFDDGQFICSGSFDNTVRVLDAETNKQIRSLNTHPDWAYCVKFSPYHYRTNHRNVVCSSSNDKTIRFWDIKDDQPFQTFKEHTSWVGGIEFSPFNGGRYLCSGSGDKTIRLWDVETYKSLHVFNGHTSGIWCVAISPLQSNNKNDNSKSSNIGVIGGNGYTICSGSHDKTICIWDIETTKQMIIFNSHENVVRSVKYGSNELGINGGANTILSGAEDTSVRLWDIRSGQQIQVFNGHTNEVWAVEYSPFVVNNIEVGHSSNVICSGSRDNTIRFWDIRSNKSELHMIKDYNGILCLNFFQLKNNTKNKDERGYGINLCYGSFKGPICIWG
ncbi:WD-40 repeat protein [Reticulomyxa filosa]|uniref:WD-40 repeat protein n=1 Tax=Reticulomyxa filosa TaxID=46433 RepID=X6P613_RETFI|nr:WD-40 repeat protein [Reticulomyxa filosa]|eukprot:ETO33636.1 WD-40 repeat protein [Reticulomyxa filosa]